MTNLPRPDADSALFANYPRKVATINLCYHSAPVALQLADVNTADLEKAIDTLLERDGWSTPTSASRSASTNGTNGTYQPRERAQRVQPAYNQAGEPCCPVHKRQLSEGHHGLYCTAKGKDGEQINDKGYCSLKFAE